MTISVRNDNTTALRLGAAETEGKMLILGEKMGNGKAQIKAGEDISSYIMGTQLSIDSAKLKSASNELSKASRVIDIQDRDTASILETLKEMESMLTSVANGISGQDAKEALVRQYKEQRQSVLSIAKSSEFNGIKLLSFLRGKEDEAAGALKDSCSSNFSSNYSKLGELYGKLGASNQTKFIEMLDLVEQNLAGLKARADDYSGSEANEEKITEIKALLDTAGSLTAEKDNVKADQAYFDSLATSISGITEIKIAASAKIDSLADVTFTGASAVTAGSSDSLVDLAETSGVFSAGLDNYGTAFNIDTANLADYAFTKAAKAVANANPEYAKSGGVSAEATLSPAELALFKDTANAAIKEWTSVRKSGLESFSKYSGAADTLISKVESLSGGDLFGAKLAVSADNVQLDDTSTYFTVKGYAVSEALNKLDKEVLDVTDTNAVELSLNKVTDAIKALIDCRGDIGSSQKAVDTLSTALAANADKVQASADAYLSADTAAVAAEYSMEQNKVSYFINSIMKTIRVNKELLDMLRNS